MPQETEESHLADRLSSYADAVVAVAFVNATAFFLSLNSGQEVRCTLLNYRFLVVSLMIVVHAAYILAIWLFQRGERHLRDAAGSRSSSLVRSYRTRIYIARIGFVVLVAMINVAVIGFSLSDSSCAR